MDHLLRVQGSGFRVQKCRSLIYKSDTVLRPCFRTWIQKTAFLNPEPRTLNPLVYLILGAVGLGAAGCGRGAPPVETFEKQWHDAVNSRQHEVLYDLLDASSRRHYRQELERLRGLPDHAQQFVIERLGGERVKSLHDLTPPQYFARLWHQAAHGRRPKMIIEAHSGSTAYMNLWLDESRKLRVQLIVEAGRWVWRLPPQDLGPAVSDEG